MKFSIYLNRRVFVMKLPPLVYCNNPEYWNRQAWANSVDPDHDLHCLSLSPALFRPHHENLPI